MKRPSFLVLFYAACSGVALAQWAAVLGASRASGAPAFNPQTQGTLVNWYDTSQLGGLSNNDPITTFTDSKTGNPNPFTTSATRPTYQTNQQNSLPTTLYSYNVSFFNTGGSTASTFPYTIAAVVKVADTSTEHTIMGPDSAGGLDFRINGSTGYPALLKAGVAGIGTGTSALSTTGYHLVVCTVDSSTYHFYIDGADAGSGSHAQSLTGGKVFYMGSYNGSEGWAGYIGEIQIYSSVLSSGDLSALHDYISGKWGTP